MASECGGDSPSSLPGGGACSDTEASDNSNIDNADEKVQVSSNMQQQTVHQQQQQSPAASSSSSSSSSLVLSIREYFLVTLTSTPFVNNSVNHINTLLRYAKVPEKSLLTNEEFVLSSTAVIVTLLGYYILFGKRHRNKRRRLAEELRLAQRQVHFLEESLLKAKRDDIIASTPTRSPSSHHRKTLSLSSINSTPREIRIFMDGAFDVMHYGHMNAFRLGRSLGTYLIVGVNSDESITQCKGPPLMNDEERLTMVEACKFVDMVVPNCPYIMTSEYLDYIFETYNVDYVVHGDDPCIVDGKDVYASAKRRGRYRSIPRTEGVSTTDIVGRMLLMTKEHHLFSSSSRAGKGSGSVGNTTRTRSNSSVSFGGGGGGGHMRSDSFDDDYFDSDNEILDVDDPTIEEYNAQGGEHNDDVSVMTAANYHERDDVSVLGHQSKFLTTSMMLRLFSADVKSPEEGMKVIYVDGAWDMFHCGHVSFLKEVSKRGDYVIVGIHGDSVVNKRRGGNLPLMNLHERLLSVLGCKFMNDVLIDAPLEITPDMIASLRISEVVHGTKSDDKSDSSDMSYDDRYRYPKEMGIFTTIPSPSDFKLENILSRIQKKQAELQRKIDRKKRAEREWFDNKYQNGEKVGNGKGAVK